MGQLVTYPMAIPHQSSLGGGGEVIPIWALGGLPSGLCSIAEQTLQSCQLVNVPTAKPQDVVAYLR